MAFLRGRCMAVAVVCAQLALRTTLAAKIERKDPPGMVIEDTSSGLAGPPAGYPRVQSMVGMEGSASLFDKLDQYQRTSVGINSGAGVKQVTYVKTPYSIGEPHLDPHRRAWVPIRPDIGAIDEALAETGAKSVGRAHSMSVKRGSSRIWLLAPFTIGEPSYDDATHATFVPFYSAAQDGAGLYSVHSPTPDRGPWGAEEDKRPHNPKMYDCGTDKACRPECKGCWCTLSHILPFSKCMANHCCDEDSARSHLNLRSKSVGDATDFTPLPRSSYMSDFDENARNFPPLPRSSYASDSDENARNFPPLPRSSYTSQPTYPYAVSHPPMRSWTPPMAYAGQNGGEQFNDYAYDTMSDEYGPPQ